MQQPSHLTVVPAAIETTMDEPQVITIRVQFLPPPPGPIGDEDLQWLTLPQVCELLQLSETKVYELIQLGPQHGGLASARPGRALRVPRAEVRRWQHERLQEHHEAA